MTNLWGKIGEEKKKREKKRKRWEEEAEPVDRATMGRIPKNQRVRRERAKYGRGEGSTFHRCSSFGFRSEDEESGVHPRPHVILAQVDL